MLKQFIKKHALNAKLDPALDPTTSNQATSYNLLRSRKESQEEMGALLRSRETSKDYHHLRIKSAVVNNKIKNSAKKNFVSKKVIFIPKIWN